MKVRIIQRTGVEGIVWYVIQKRFLWFWWLSVHSCDTLEEAMNNLCYYDGTKIKDEIVFPIMH